MTLIMAAVTPKFVVLVADRRITTMDKGVVQNQDARDTKTAFIDGRYIMGFTGLARLGPLGFRMEEWLVNAALAGYKDDDYFEHLADETGKALEAANYHQAHSFLAAGYAESGEGELVMVTNAHDLAGEPLYPRYPHSLNVVRLALGDRPFRFAHVGAVQLDTSELQYVYKKTRASARGARPTQLVQALLTVLRGAAHRSQGTIGTAAVVTIMARGAVPVLKNPTFLNWPPESVLANGLNLSFAVPDESNPDDGRMYGPAIWSRASGSTYGYRGLITAAPSGSPEQEALRTGDLSDFDLGKNGLASTMKGFPPSVLEDFPRHPLPPRED